MHTFLASSLFEGNLLLARYPTIGPPLPVRALIWQIDFVPRVKGHTRTSTTPSGGSPILGQTLTGPAGRPLHSALGLPVL